MDFITNYLVYNSQKYAEKVAIVWKDKEISWKELYKKVSCWAEKLKTLVKGEGRIVGIFLPNSLEFIISHLAVLSLKHISWPIDPQYKEVELEPLIKEIKPALLITDEIRAQQVKSARVLLTEKIETSTDNNLEICRVKGKPERTAATLLLTSGTTGKPKATLYSHANHLWNVKTLSKVWRWTQKDSILLSLPLSHWHGLVIGLTGSIYHGNTIYLEERFETERTLELLSSGKISLFMHVPSAYQRIVNFPDAEKYDLSKVRLFISGSSYLPPSLWEEFYRKFGVKILERYGSSEAGIICSNPYEERIPGSVGYPLPDVKIKLLNEKGEEITDEEKEGEVAVSSPGIFMGYYKEGKVIPPQLKDGFLRTGDIGIIKNGRLYLKGRIPEKIKKKGYSVYPRDIEWVVNLHPEVRECYVLGVQRENQIDDEIVYFVVPKRQISQKQFYEYCREKMPNYWLPDKVIFLKEIPKTNSGKPKMKMLYNIYLSKKNSKKEKWTN